MSSCTVLVTMGLVLSLPAGAADKAPDTRNAAVTTTAAPATVKADTKPVSRTVRCTGKQPWTDEVVAKSIAVPVARLRALKAARSLTNEQVCTMPEPMLKRAWSKLETGKAGYPDQWAEFRNLQRKSDDGKVKPDGLMRGFEHRRAVLKKIAEKKAARSGKPGEAPAAYQAVADPAGAALTTAEIPDSGVDISMAGIQANQWTDIGPGNIGGRLRTIVIDPDNTNSIWVGGVAGGIYHSADYGASFSPVYDFMANLSISSIVMDPANHDVMYAGTGEGFFNADGVRGYGVFKSTNRGESWSFLTATTPSTNASDYAYGWYYVNRLAISSNGATLLAATRGAYSNYGGSIYRSVDGGATWSQRHTAARVLDIRFDPNDPGKAVAATQNYNTGTSLYDNAIITSTDGGLTWTAKKTFSTSGFIRIELAYSKANSQVIYASVDQNSGEIWKSTDGGATWGSAPVGTPQHLGNQGWYDNTIWADPTDASHVVAAGLDVHRSTNGGTTWTKISNWSTNQIDIRYGSGTSHTPHADHHALVADPNYNGTTNRVLYNGNDGGLYRAPDITLAGESSGWDELNNGIGLTQFYSVAGKSSAGTRIIGGAQDNGMLYNAGPGTSWKMFNGGDGGYSAVDATNDNYLYGEYVYLQIGRSTDRGATFNSIDKLGSFQLTDSRSANANFIAPFILDPNDSNRMLAGGRSLWQNTAVRTGFDWTAIKASTGSNISAIAVAEGNGNIVWVGHNNGEVYYTTNGLNASPTWTKVSSATTGTAQGRIVNRILIDRSDATKVYVSYGGYNNNNIWRTGNSGSTWTDLNSPARVLPSVPYFALERHPTNANWLYVGTEVGLFTSQDGGTTWSASNDGPANVEIADLVWRDATTLIAATHGRGMFTATVNAKTASTASVATSLNPSAYGQSITLTATVTPGAATGTVTFKDGSTVLGTGTLSGGSATLVTAALHAGIRSITAVYGGDGSYNGATSPTLSQTVTKVTPIVSAWPTASAITYGQALSAATFSGGTTSVPGTFAFTTPTTVRGIGTASATVIFTPTDSINYNSVSGSVNVTVTPAPLTVTAAAKVKAFGAADPSLTYSASGFVNGDTAAIMGGSLTRVAGEAVGTYAILQGTVTAGSSYTITYVGANLTIGNPVVKVVISGQPDAPYVTIGDAIAAVSPGTTASFLLVGGDIPESISCAANATISLTGGYNAPLTLRDGSLTTLRGLTVSGAAVTVDGIALGP